MSDSDVPREPLPSSIELYGIVIRCLRKLKEALKSLSEVKPQCKQTKLEA